VGGQNHALDALFPRPGTHVQEARWVPGPVWTDAENFAPTGIPSSGRPARSESLYRLSYPGHFLIYGSLFNDCVFTTYYTASNVRKQPLQKDAKGIGGDADIYMGGLRRTTNNPKKDSLCHGRIRTRHHQHISLQQELLLE